MVRRRVVLPLLLLVFCMGTSVSLAVEFSADFIVQTKGEPDITGKIAVKGDKVRQEITQESEKQIMLMRPDKSVTWLITPDEKKYMEIPYQSENKVFEDWTSEKESKSKLVGEESVSGLPCKKFEMNEDGEKATYWVSTKYSFPLKIEDGETTMEYRNLKDEKVPDSQFELPAGLEKMPMPPMGQAE